MRPKDWRSKRYFINLIPGNNDHPDQMRINGRKFDLSDIKRQKVFLKVYIDYFYQNCKYFGANFEKEMREILNGVQSDYQKVRKRYGQRLRKERYY